MIKFTVKDNTILDIDVDTITDNKIVFPSEVDGETILTVALTSYTIDFLNKKLSYYDVVFEEGIKDIKQYMFECSNIRNVTIPSTITEIPRGCFSNSEIESVTFNTKGGHGIKTICFQAFSLCSELKSITIPKTVVTIETSAFDSSGISSLHFEYLSSLCQMGDRAFYNCKNLRTVHFPKFAKPHYRFQFAGSITASLAFAGCDNLLSVDMSTVNIDRIPSCIFSNCKNLKAVTLPKGIKTIGLEAFYCCSSLEGLNLKDTKIIVIEASAFAKCENFTDGYLPETVTFIGSNAFDSCNIKNLKLPPNLKDVCDHAFCSNPIEEVDLTPLINCETIGAYLFCQCNIKQVHIPKLKIYSDLRNMFSLNKQLEKVTMEPGAQIGPFMFSFCTSLKEVTLPSDIESIPVNAFQGCHSLKNIDIPACCKEIEEGAFDQSGLIQLNLKANIPININRAAFYGCPGLTGFNDIELPPFDTVCDKLAFNPLVMVKLCEKYPFLTVTTEGSDLY